MKKRLRSKYSFKDIRGIQTLKRLEYILNEKADYLIELAAQKNEYYHPFVIEEPGKKPREIDQPTGELLQVQTKIRDRLLDLVPLSEITFGAVEGMSTTMSAKKHLMDGTVVKLDLKDCYHSSKARRVKQLFRMRFGFSEGVSNLLTELCTYQGYVPVGSTLSSTLVNLILNPLWEKVNDYRRKHGMGASTWVDDLALSGKQAEKHIEVIKKMINSYGYRISWSKQEIQRSNVPQEVNGRNVTSKKVTIPKAKKRKLVLALKKDPKSDSVRGMLADASASGAKSQVKQLKKLQKKLLANYK